MPAPSALAALLVLALAVPHSVALDRAEEDVPLDTPVDGMKNAVTSRRLMQEPPPAPPSPSPLPPPTPPPPPPYEGGTICPATCACCINDRCTMDQGKCDEVRTIVLSTVGGATFLAAVTIWLCYRRSKARRRAERERAYTVTAAPGYEPGGTFT